MQKGIEMEFFGIIFYVIVIAIFVSAKRMGQSTNRHSNHKPTPNTPAKGRVTTPNAPAKGKVATPNVPRKKNYAKVFMEPHKEEAHQPRIRTNNLWGEDQHAHERIVALRLMEGDPVPEGYTRIKCPYCGADNLVTKHCKQYHSCYFCRVPID